MATEIEHGTYRGYRQHLKRRRAGLPGGDACEPCLDANAEYMRNLRAANPDSYQRGLTVAACRDRALRRLAERHPGELEELYREERRCLLVHQPDEDQRATGGVS